MSSFEIQYKQVRCPNKCQAILFKSSVNLLVNSQFQLFDVSTIGRISFRICFTQRFRLRNCFNIYRFKLRQFFKGLVQIPIRKRSTNSSNQNQGSCCNNEQFLGDLYGSYKQIALLNKSYRGGQSCNRNHSSLKWKLILRRNYCLIVNCYVIRNIISSI